MLESDVQLRNACSPMFVTPSLSVKSESEVQPLKASREISEEVTTVVKEVQL